jgi:D-lactate dehydrogenase
LEGFEGISISPLIMPLISYWKNYIYVALYIALRSVGYDNVDLKKARALIKVANVPCTRLIQ